MLKDEFRRWLQENPSIKSVHSPNTRINRLMNVEIDNKVNVDEIVRNDDEMFSLLRKLKIDDPKGHKQNALRHYYEFINGKRFPKLADYERSE